MNGVINLYKAPGMSSAQAVGAIKRITACRVGHAGTLDPEAAGVLPIMVGRTTKLFDFITDDLKVYLTEIAFGSATDTQDAQGQIIRQSKDLPDEKALLDCLSGFLGTVMQVPPAYSAIKKDGKKMYELARSGKAPELDARPVQIHGIELIKRLSSDGFLLRVRCGKGTYIRTLCHDIGEKMGIPAHMRFLLREHVGLFDIQDSITLEELKLVASGELQKEGWLIGPEQILSGLPSYRIPEALLVKARNGAPLPLHLFTDDVLENGAFIRLYDQANLISVSYIKDGVILPRTMMNVEE